MWQEQILVNDAWLLAAIHCHTCIAFLRNRERVHHLVNISRMPAYHGVYDVHEQE